MLTVPRASAAVAVLVAVGMFLMAVPVAEAQDACANHADGCSIPWGLNFFYKRKFTPSCNRHDICYGCGAAYGFSRSSCDTKFLNNMNAACGNDRGRRHASLEKRSTCTAMARGIYYKAVHVFGRSHYRNRGDTEYYCHYGFVRGCLS
eukprot:TRINITY_DN60154_c0_g3_i1.p1 TRINITY_DN60154_c0_g3~~TRINITY_DN60154_c0_g3_i1.p1  ORF type:complete len:148 (+),score=12.05 TRINITY_DN60154_c0_g3_i1:93-536(+)